MISRFPVCMRAESMAVSFASEPELVKNDFSRRPGVICAIFSARTAMVSCG